MSSRSKILEDYLRFRVKPNLSVNRVLPTAPSKSQLNRRLEDTISNSLSYTIDDLNNLRRMSDDREIQYRVYDEMEEDSIIASALDMYADDATQYDSTGRRIWVECSGDDDDANQIKSSVEYHLRMLRIEDNCWDHIRSLCKYGDLYLETFREVKDTPSTSVSSSGGLEIYKSSDQGNLDEYLEVYDDPSVVFDLTEKGKTVGFVVTPKPISSQSTQSYSSVSSTNSVRKSSVYSPDKFIHITLRRFTTRNPETITLNLATSSNSKETEPTTYKVLRGKSILHDIYKSYQELKLLEDSMILNRLNKSAIVRLLQVEVGDTPKSQVSMILRRLKDMIEQKIILNKNSGETKSIASPGPIENIVYVPTRNGKGAITAQTLGGDVDVKSIMDIEYSSDKVFGGLKIPKSYLGQTSEGEGGLNGGTSLTKKDSRYARTIKAVQSAYLSGITNAINMFLIDKGLESYVNKFSLRMVSPSTTEDAERDESLNTKLDIASKVIDLIKSSDDETGETPSRVTPEVISWILTTYLGEFSGLSNLISSEQSQISEDSEDTEDADSSEFDDESFGEYDDDMMSSDDEYSLSDDKPTNNPKPELPPEVKSDIESFGDFGGDM